MKIDILLLAAGASARMRGRDKMLESIVGKTLLHHSARVATESDAHKVHVVTVKERASLLADLDVNIVVTEANQLMSHSLITGMQHVSGDAVVLALADMPDITVTHYNQLMSALAPAQNRKICRAVSEDGKAGNPVLFSSQFFDQLKQISGDQGARMVIKNNAQYVHNVKTAGRAAICDLDTPEDWQNWRK